MSNHDSKNTTNASQLLALGTFKLVPLKDFVPYEELLKLRLEVGLAWIRDGPAGSEEGYGPVCVRVCVCVCVRFTCIPLVYSFRCNNLHHLGVLQVFTGRAGKAQLQV